MKYYGFAIQNNVNNSYTFNVRMNVDLESGYEIMAKNIVANNSQTNHIQEIKLKYN